MRLHFICGVIAAILLYIIYLRSNKSPDPLVFCDCGCGTRIPRSQMVHAPHPSPDLITPTCYQELYNDASH
jgi:hypothetical protein